MRLSCESPRHEFVTLHSPHDADARVCMAESKYQWFLPGFTYDLFSLACKQIQGLALTGVSDTALGLL